MNYKFWLLSIILLFITVSSALAAPPVDNYIFVPATTGYVIKAPEIFYNELNSKITFNFHVFNNTNGYPIAQSDVSCYFHLYNDSGNHIYTVHNYTTLEHLWDYSIKVDGNNFTHAGTYYYIFQCNSSRSGGFITSSLEVNDLGRDKNDSTNADLVVFYFSMSIALFFILFPLIRTKMHKNEIASLIFRRSMMALGIVFMLFSSGIVSTIIEKSSFNLLQEVFTYMWLFELALYLMLTFLMIATIFSIVKSWSEITRKRRMGEE